jgi:hypothetical protein
LFCAALLSVSPTNVVGQTVPSRVAASSEPIYLIVRSDDGGMSHSVNRALERVIASGMPVAVVDADGYFFSTSDALHRNNPDLRQVELELRAQIDRAVRSGLKIDYVDYHMGTVSRYPELREIAERLAREYGLGMSGYFGEVRDNPQYAAAPPSKTDSLVAMIDRLRTPFNLLVTHVGIDDAELGALIDMNVDGGLPDMSKNRQGELDALTSGRFRDTVRARDVTLITYRQLIEMKGLKSMRRPGEG